LKLRSDYIYLEKVDTRFGDNDVFGHLNNVIYYAIFDSVINRFLINKCDYNPLKSEFIAISPETRCKFRNSLKYPDKIEAGLSTFKIGDSSVIYDISLFKVGENKASAEGYFVHVFVKRKDMKQKVSMPDNIRKELEKITARL